MKRRWVLALITANLMALGVLIFRYPDLMLSPGPLTAAHADIATDCFACHAPLRGVAPARCISCHAVADIGLRTAKGLLLSTAKPRITFHQQLSTQNCVGCHSGHEGSALALGSRHVFSHALLLPSVRATCQTCHTAPDTTIHRGVTANCAQCHGQDGWKPAMIDHTSRFALYGVHATACATCHIGNDTSRYTCFGCHEHQPDQIRAKHLREGIPNYENCVACHRSARGEHGEGGEGGSQRKRAGRDND